MNVSPSGVANSSVPDSVITNCGSGSGCQSYEECAGVSLKWMATTSVRSFSSIVPSSTCDALSAPVYNLNARTISLSPLNSFQHGGALIAASARGDLSSEHAVANRGVDQHEREHEQAFAPEHEGKARMRSGGFLDGDGERNHIRPERDGERAECCNKDQRDHVEGRPVAPRADADRECDRGYGADRGEDEQIRA